MSHIYSFAGLEYLLWNELTFLVIYDIIMRTVMKTPQKYKSTCVFINDYMVTLIIIKKVLKKMGQD